MRSGAPETCGSSANDRSSSRIRKIAPETDSAQTQRTPITLRFWGEEPEAAKDGAEPEHQHYQEWRRDRRAQMLKQQHARMAHIERIVSTWLRNPVHVAVR
jgi:hypothetical protein